MKNCEQFGVGAGDARQTRKKQSIIFVHGSFVAVLCARLEFLN